MKEHFLQWMKPQTYWKVTDKCSRIKFYILYMSPRAGIKLTTSVMIGTDCKDDDCIGTSMIV